MIQAQATYNLLMIRPVQFKFNEETASSNAFQDASAHTLQPSLTQADALREFDEMANRLKSAGVNVLVFDDVANSYSPDSIFPNNWVSFHHSGKVVLYPMQAENRRAERRMDIIQALQKDFQVDVVLDFSHFEGEGKFLEGTGSLVLDRMHRIAYACLSSRTNEDVLAAWAKQMNGYKIVKFHANDQNNLPIYHTNVMMCIGNTFAVVCLDAITNPDERLQVRDILEKSGKHIIPISLEQMANFAGNMLLISKKNGHRMLVMSTRAYHSLTKAQIDELDDYAEIMHFDLDMIEKCGGGSARCMLAEIHLVEK